jgi:hypothetical protein
VCRTHGKWNFDDTETRGANFVVRFQPTTGIHGLLTSGKEHPVQVEFSDIIKTWFEEKCNEHTEIQLFTEVLLPQDDGDKVTVLRAHPDCRTESPWHDCALAKRDEEGRNDTDPVHPCKMVGFFTDPENGAKMALVQEVNFQTENQRQRDSQLFRHWTLRSKENRTTKRHDAVLVALPLEVLSDRIYVIDPIPVGGFSRAEPGDYDMLAVKHIREEWPVSFLKSHEYFNSYDWM